MLMRWFFRHVSKRLLAAMVGSGICLALVLCFLMVRSDANRSPATNNSSGPAVRQNLVYEPNNTPLPKQQTAHVIHKIETKLPVVFLTMDDGQIKDERATEFLKQRQWPVSLFLADIYVRENYDYFRRIMENGATIQNHTSSHKFLKDLTFFEQKEEICTASDKIQQTYGKRPSLLRPPGGFYNYSTLFAANECGIKAVVMWSAKVDGGMVQYQTGDHLVAGDIILMHFRPKIMEDLAAFEAEITKQGLYVARLEDWIKIAP